MRWIKDRDPSNEHSASSLQMELPADVDLYEILREFACFLRACGYVFDGEIQIVEEQADE